jgi:prepilin-type N-terminal cleavage/methylation domain-containing protein
MGRRRSPRPPAAGRHQRGFTLIELLVTLGITVVGLTGLLSLHLATVSGNERTADAGQALTIAQEKLEEMRAYTVPRLLTRFSTASLPIDASLDTVTGRTGIVYRPRIQVEEMTAFSPDLVRIRQRRHLRRALRRALRGHRDLVRGVAGQAAGRSTISIATAT